MLQILINYYTCPQDEEVSMEAGSSRRVVSPIVWQMPPSGDWSTTSSPAVVDSHPENRPIPPATDGTLRDLPSLCNISSATDHDSTQVRVNKIFIL